MSTLSDREEALFNVLGKINPLFSFLRIAIDIDPPFFYYSPPPIVSVTILTLNIFTTPGVSLKSRPPSAGFATIFWGAYLAWSETFQLRCQKSLHFFSSPLKFEKNIYIFNFSKVLFIVWLSLKRCFFLISLLSGGIF